MRATPALAGPDVRRRLQEAIPIAALVGSLALWYLSPFPVVSLALMAVYSACCWRWPRHTLALLPLTFPFWFAPKHVGAGMVFPLSELALLVGALMIGVRVALRERSAIAPHRLLVAARGYMATIGPATALGAFLLLAGMSVGVLIAARPHDALRAWRWEIAEPLLYFALFTTQARGQRWARMTLWAFVTSGMMVAALAIAQTLWFHVTFQPITLGGGLASYGVGITQTARATAIIYGDPNSAGAWMERALPLALAVALAGREIALRERAIAVGALALLASGLWLTGSRGAWLGAGASIALVCVALLAHEPILARRKRYIGRLRVTTAAGAGIVVRVIAGVVIVGGFLLYFTATLWLAPLAPYAGKEHGDSTAIRLLVWEASWNMARDHPLLGVGPDQFLYYYDPQFTSHPYLIGTVDGKPTIAAAQPTLAHPHNLALDVWLSAGVLGLAGYTLVLLGAARKIIRLWQRDSPIHVWPTVIAVGIAGMLVASLAHGMVDIAYFRPDLALALWWSVAALVALDYALPRTANGRS